MADDYLAPHEAECLFYARPYCDQQISSKNHFRGLTKMAVENFGGQS